MDKQLQQRLVGAVVLVSLGVIFIPALLDGAGYKSRHSRSIEIPVAPEFAPLTQLEVAKIKTPKQLVADKTVEKPEPESKKQAVKLRAPIVKPTVVTKKKVTEPVQAWVVQVGTFSQKSNALVLQDKLRADKHPAFVTDSKVKGKTSYKVKVGPIVDKARADRLKEKIKKSHDLNGYVTRHP